MSWTIRAVPRTGRSLAYLVCFVFVSWANFKTPLWADDYCRIGPPGLASPFVVAWRDYWHWTGRFFVTALTSIVLQPSVWRLAAFDCLNAAVFIALVVQVLALSRLAAGIAALPLRGGLPGATEIMVAALLVWWLPRSIAEVALWKTGSIGYLWAVTGEMWVVRRTLSGNGRPGVLPTLAAFLFATFLEPLSLLVSVLLVSCCAWRWRSGRSAPVVLAVAHAAGTALLLGAPGNFVRAAGLGATSPGDRLAGVLGNVGSLFDPYWLLAVGVIAVATAAPSADPARAPVPGAARLRAGRAWMFVLVALLYMGILLGVPRVALAARVSFPASLCLVCYVVAVFQRRPAAASTDRIAAAGCAMLLAAHVAIVVPELDRLAVISQRWVAASRLHGADAALVLPSQRVGGRIVYARKSRFFEGLSPDPANFVNVCFARVMHVRSVVAR